MFGPDAETTAPRAVGTESTSLLSHSCPEGHIGGLADEIALRASAITAQQAMEVLPTDTAGNVARVAFTVLWIIAEEELQAAEAKNALAEQCEQDNHRSILHNIVGPRVDIAVSTRATQTSVANIDADVAAHDTNIDADVAAHNANIDSDLVAHNTNIDSDLVAHNANIDSDLVAHNDNIDADVAAHDTNLTSRVNEIRGLVGGIGETLDTTVEMKYVHLQVIEVKRPPSLNARHRVRGRYLLIATEAGVPVDVTLTGLNVSIGAPNGPISFVDALGDATATSVATGTLDIDLRVAGNTKIFQFLVEHSHGPDPSHFGATMFHRAAAKNIGPGQ